MNRKLLSNLSILYLPALVIGFLYWFSVRQFLLDNAVPGDLGDGRFNIYVLEHVFRWILGQDPSFSSPAFFYPFPGALFFSDTHVGSAIFYIGFRAAGLSEYRSFTLWVLAGYFLTFIACYVAALKFGYKPFLAVVIATIFSFSLPSITQLGHAQLVYRFAVPLAFLSCWRLVQTGDLRQILWLVSWIGLQVLCSFYLGMFLAIAIVAFLISAALVDRHRRPAAGIARDLVLSSQQAFLKPSLQDGLLLLVTVMITISSLALLLTYHEWAILYGLKRTWTTITPPQIVYYFTMNTLPYWKAIYDFFGGASIPDSGEHNLFMGLGVLGLFVAGLGAVYTEMAGNRFLLAKSSALALGIVICLTTVVVGHSLYYFLTYIPGMNAIRAVSRISIILMFFVAIIAAEGTATLINSRPRAPGAALAVLFLTLSVLDILMIKKYQFSAAEAEFRTLTIAGEARRLSNGNPNPVLSLMEEGELPYKIHLDAMLAAQRLGWATSNGYSGNEPPGYDYRLTCNSPAKQFSAYEAWHEVTGRGPDLHSAELLKRTVRVEPPTCPSFTDRDVRVSFGSSPTEDVARDIQLSPVSFERHGSGLVFEVDIHNGGDRRISALSFAPVRLSWRFVPLGHEDTPDNKISWDTTRQAIPGDLIPKRDLRMKLTGQVPKQPGTYQLEVSLVAEHSFWFHDKGTKVLRFDPPVVVE